MRRIRFAALLGCLALLLSTAAPAWAASTAIGGGSSYVALAMNDWKTGAIGKGIPVDYNGNLGSPDGIVRFGANTVTFAGTEAEVSSLEKAGIGGAATRQRGFQYIPDVAGAIAVMYNVTDAGGKPVNYLHLDQPTIGRIFSGDITRWSDPAITATNGGKALPDQPIKLIGRGGDSGTTALFYDFVAHAAPEAYRTFMTRSGMANFLPDIRPINLQNAELAQIYFSLQANSDNIASTVKTMPWSIGYDEFAYAKYHQVQAAWVRNAAGQWVQPYAKNIAAALTKADLRPDLSQELSGVYTNPDPLTYPISAYSYIMAPCQVSPDRDTCKGGYPDPGVTETMSRFLDHIACAGQVNMAAIGYSPLPPNLSQEMMNSIGRLTGQPPKQLTPANCANPTFHGSLGAGSESPPDPFAAMGGVDKLTKGGTGDANTPADSSGTETAAQNAGQASADAGEEDLANGGSKNWRNAEPAAYQGNSLGGFGAWAALVLFAAIVLPLVVRGVIRKLRGAR
ncbi:PstS family phosphate ABC transporter substrate-binding protein [Amycolatopsis anabasis]|uniref:PstS family phosphate ABC transporter substrate-binding protein n=1 Tax=Amycolatopsis anabasis TaxID=1840409 RepID=UPI001FEA842E|nr:substrate-binding domain-containing protein [Amycolatopsis anabasis]